MSKPKPPIMYEVTWTESTVQKVFLTPENLAILLKVPVEGLNATKTDDLDGQSMAYELGDVKGPELVDFSSGKVEINRLKLKQPDQA